jgi:hypothetical protein
MTKKMTDEEWADMKKEALWWYSHQGNIEDVIEYCESLREAQRWRSVEDEVPEAGIDVLTWVVEPGGRRFRQVNKIASVHQRRVYWAYVQGYYGEITHWMSLPPAPPEGS